ncbi:RNase adapter RapZ [Eikenella sp. S3360]|uniref:RNase adapter RapZ n=1 Tax=Eikenella glucosivorans TaxID=2766967 RepID=A0ABS0NB56_9NEIS|nr:RNase adapter RapZ [Eikenella glucosivorans]MBH5329549.1 RNase adapter RapZ [Eikenella glucosivorans]
MRIVLISGPAGSGKTVALKLLDNMGFTCVDNIPPALLPQLVAQSAAGKISKLAVSLDIRVPYAKDGIQNCLRAIRRQGHPVRLLFLDADDATLIRRLDGKHRRHPLAATNLTLAESIAAERQILQPWQDFAFCINNSLDGTGDLKFRIQEWLALSQGGLQVVVESFGFKYGAPLDLDFLFDVRALPNPYYDEALRELTGRDEAVRAYFARFKTVQQMVADISGYLNRWLPEYARQTRVHMLVVGIGCTGGQHRSVFVAEAVAERLRDYPVWVRHRQLPGNGSRM